MLSLLFVPGHDARKLAKSLESGADALILDLEDSVPEGDKARARVSCAEFVRANRKRMPLFVRINPLGSGFELDDLAAVVRESPFGVMLPKCEGGHHVTAIANYLSALEARDGIVQGGTRIFPIVTETAASLLDMGTYSQPTSPRLWGMLWGGEDLASDIGTGANRGPDGSYTAPFILARSLTLLAAASTQSAAIDGVYENFRDGAGLRAEATQARRDGFVGKAAIHPDQIGPIHEVFTPSAEELTRAHRVVAAFAAGGGAIALDGQMITMPHLRAARRVLARGAIKETT